MNLGKIAEKTILAGKGALKVGKGVVKGTVKAGKTVAKGTVWTAKATASDFRTITGGVKKVANSGIFQDFDREAVKNFGDKIDLKYITGKELSTKGKAAVLGVGATIGGVQAADAVLKANSRIKMGEISEDTEGLPNKVSANASTTKIGDDVTLEQTQQNLQGHIRDLGADGEFAMALHKLHGTGQNRYI